MTQLPLMTVSRVVARGTTGLQRAGLPGVQLAQPVLAEAHVRGEDVHAVVPVGEGEAPEPVRLLEGVLPAAGAAGAGDRVAAAAQLELLRERVPEAPPNASRQLAGGLVHAGRAGALERPQVVVGAGQAAAPERLGDPPRGRGPVPTSASGRPLSGARLRRRRAPRGRGFPCEGGRGREADVRRLPPPRVVGKQLRLLGHAAAIANASCHRVSHPDAAGGADADLARGALKLLRRRGADARERAEVCPPGERLATSRDARLLGSPVSARSREHGIEAPAVGRARASEQGCKA